ncbi:hypothetical protein LX36DRAFT_533949, partial [Colletotrichum falcatum]
VMPFESMLSKSAPALRRLLTISSCPLSAPYCTGVRLCSSIASTQAPASSRIPTTSRCPSSAAICIEVLPS